MNKNEKLKNQNNQKKRYYQKINKVISEANNISLKKNELYQQSILKDNKLNEYREKIKLLKLKINEFTNNNLSQNKRIIFLIQHIIPKKMTIKIIFSNSINQTRELNNSQYKYNNKHNSSFTFDYNDDNNHFDFNNKNKIIIEKTK